MKHFGCFLEFTKERNADLLRAFRHFCAKASYIRLADIAYQAVNSPSKRFWVSEFRALAVCSQLLRGLPVLDAMRPTKREMFEEIFRRVCDLRKADPHRPLMDIVSEVVYSPAPKFYMEPSSAYERFFKIRSGWYDKRNKKNNMGE